MFQKFIILFLTVAALLSACGTLEVSVALTPDPTSTQPSPVEATSTPPATYTPPSQEADTPAPDINSPTFSDISFFDVTNTAPDCSHSYRRTFPGRIRQIYAEWHY